MDREKVIKDLDELYRLIYQSNVDGEILGSLHDTITLLKEQPEIIRCKDCKNADYGTDEDGNRFMKCIGSVKCYGGTTPDFFCADGERR